MMQIRTAQRSDSSLLRQLFYDTVHHVNCRDYSQDQLDAWAPALSNPHSWQPQFKFQWTLVAEVEGKIVGFGELDRDGHIGCFYCHYQHQGEGIGSALMEWMEAIAFQQGMDRLWAEVSITAKPFFERHRFQTLRAQTVERYGVLLTNFAMDKLLRLGEEMFEPVWEGTPQDP
jgi:putative acetyltransferase